MAEEKINFEEEETKMNSSMQELGLADLGSNWIKHPKVGEEIDLDIMKVYKDTNIKARTKEGKSFTTALSGVDFKYTIETKDGKKYSPGSWEVWNKIRDIIQKEKKMEVKVKIKHIRDGQAEKDAGDNYEVTQIE